MLKNFVIIHKHIEKKILQDYFLIEGFVDINAKYFIDQINKGIVREDNLSHRTYVKDQMTCWDYFNEDEKFIKILHTFMDFLDKNIPMSRYRLTDAWGYRMNSGGETREHDHKPNIWSGVLYLNNHKQTLDFPEIKYTVKPEKGKFVIFSSILLHKSERHRESDPKYGISFNFGQVSLLDN
tara:strand:- start:53 stop:595 length:543 start_codon:yes stop_codon:yes gene_type:complete